MLDTCSLILIIVHAKDRLSRMVKPDGCVRHVCRLRDRTGNCYDLHRVVSAAGVAAWLSHSTRCGKGNPVWQQYLRDPVACRATTLFGASVLRCGGVVMADRVS